MRSRRFLPTTRVGRVIAVGVVVLVVAGVAVAVAANREQSTDTANGSCHVEPQGSGSGMRALPTGLYRGITFADESSADAAALDDQVATITALPHMPVTRVVFDPDTDPLEYCGAINALQPVSYLVGELVDSESIKNLDGAE